MSSESSSMPGSQRPSTWWRWWSYLTRACPWRWFLSLFFFSLCIPLNCFIIFSRAASFARRSADCPIPVLPVGSEACTWSAFTARRHVAHGGVDAKLQVSDTDQHATALAWPSLLRYGRCALLWNMWPVLHYCVLPFYSMDYDEKRYA